MPTPQNIFLKDVADLALSLGQQYVADRNKSITLHHLVAKGNKRNGNSDVFLDYELSNNVIVVDYQPEDINTVGNDQVERKLQAILSFEKLPIDLQAFIVKPELQNRMLKEDSITWNDKKMTISEILFDPAEATVSFILDNIG